jgi:hypothetical protein
MTHRAREIILIIGSLVLLGYQIGSPVLDRWHLANRLGEITEPTVSAATIVKVWAYKKTGIYYCPDSHFYGKFKPGMYMTQEEALERGYQPAAQQPCR